MYRETYQQQAQFSFILACWNSWGNMSRTFGCLLRPGSASRNNYGWLKELRIKFANGKSRGYWEAHWLWSLLDLPIQFKSQTDKQSAFRKDEKLNWRNARKIAFRRRTSLQFVTLLLLASTSLLQNTWRLREPPSFIHLMLAVLITKISTTEG